MSLDRQRLSTEKKIDTVKKLICIRQRCHLCVISLLVLLSLLTLCSCSRKVDLTRPEGNERSDMIVMLAHTDPAKRYAADIRYELIGTFNDQKISSIVDQDFFCADGKNDSAVFHTDTRSCMTVPIRGSKKIEDRHELSGYRAEKMYLKRTWDEESTVIVYETD